jgi:hypothetical protein
MRTAFSSLQKLQRKPANRAMVVWEPSKT